MDFIDSGKLPTDAVKFFVLDEADRLLDTGTQELIMKLFSKLPKAATGTQRLQVCLLIVDLLVRRCQSICILKRFSKLSKAATGTQHLEICLFILLPYGRAG